MPRRQTRYDGQSRCSCRQRVKLQTTVFPNLLTFRVPYRLLSARLLLNDVYSTVRSCTFSWKKLTCRYDILTNGESLHFRRLEEHAMCSWHRQHKLRTVCYMVPEQAGRVLSSSYKAALKLNQKPQGWLHVRMRRGKEVSWCEPCHPQITQVALISDYNVTPQ